MYAELEDQLGDVVGKARRGQEIEVAVLAREAGVDPEQLNRLEKYQWMPPDETVRRLADCLGLDPEKLVASANKRFFPLYPAGRSVEGLVVEMLVLGRDFLMNGYVVGCAQTRKGAIIDPGFDAEKILKAIEAAELEIELVLLTHGHGDHVGALSEICQATEAPAFINKADLPLLGNLSTKIEGGIVDGEVFSVGRIELMARATSGHTPGGMSLVHAGAAFVGDALFAGSLGGTRNRTAYKKQQELVGECLLGLDDEVLLYPGHGPATSVREEKQNNPFFC